MEHDNYILACLYCGDVMPKPSEEQVKMLGESPLDCCEHTMVEIDMNEMYKVVRCMDKLKDKIEEEMLAGL